MKHQIRWSWRRESMLLSTKLFGYIWPVRRYGVLYLLSSVIVLQYILGRSVGRRPPTRIVIEPGSHRLDWWVMMIMVVRRWVEVWFVIDSFLLYWCYLKASGIRLGLQSSMREAKSRLRCFPVVQSAWGCCCWSRLHCWQGDDCWAARSTCHKARHHLGRSAFGYFAYQR